MPKVKGKNPGGRPSSYKKSYCDKVVELMKGGASIEEVCLELDVCKQTFYNWCETHSEFMDAKKKGEEFSQGWWMAQGRKGLWADSKQETQKLNYTGWYMNMKNRFGWKDKQEVKHEGQQVQITYQEINGSD